MASTSVAQTRAALLAELLEAGYLVPSGVPGVYGRSAVFQAILDGYDDFVTGWGADQDAEVLRFPPIMSRPAYEATDHAETMPQLMGVVHSFDGDEAELRDMVARMHAGQEWTESLGATGVVMCPSACYSLYPTAAGTLPEGGRTVDLKAFVYRNEPSVDPARLQIFLQREYVFLGGAEAALAHRDEWVRRSVEMHEQLGLTVSTDLSTDPFFGRGGRVMKATQREQELKVEILVPVTSDDELTAIASSNYHLDLFGRTFGIHAADGEVAHSACVGFGLERVALALLVKHGMDPDSWPGDVKDALEL